MNDSSARILASLLETRTGQQLAVSRRWRIETALRSVMRERAIPDLDRLVAAVVSARDPGLADDVVEALLNNETYFYRDRAPFELLLAGPLARLEQARAGERRIGIWCAGCSTGQEVYSLAMSFAEQKTRWHGWKIDILGTDVSKSAIERARKGLYSQFEVQRGLPVVQMMRWFDERENEHWQISDDIRSSVRFQARNLTDAPPMTNHFDIVLCRNVLLYFPAPVRRTVFERIAAASRSDAMLMLGAGETVIGQTDAFMSDPEHRGLYIRTPAADTASERRYKLA